MPHAPLRALLGDLFTGSELRRFVGALPDGDMLVASLPAELASLDELAASAADLLGRHGAITDPLFIRLVEARPGRLQDIEAVAAGYGRKIGEQARMRVLLREHHDSVATQYISSIMQRRPEDPDLIIAMAELTRSQHDAVSGDGTATSARDEIEARVLAAIGDDSDRDDDDSDNDDGDPIEDGVVQPTTDEYMNAVQAVALHREIRELVQADRVEHAALRLLDFAGTFGRGGEALDEAIVLAARVREHYRVGGVEQRSASERHAAWIELLRELLRVATAVAQRYRVALAEPGARSHVQTSGPVMRAQGLCKSFRRGGRRAGFTLRDISLTLRPGTITGVVGPNGAGKTTLLRIACGELLPDAGHVTYPGLDPGHTGAVVWHRAKAQIGYVAQRVRPWYGRMIEELYAWAARHGLSVSDNLRAVRFYLERLGLAAYAEARWSELSGGFQVRFELARVLLTRPRLIVLDEPLAPLDVITQEQFLRDIRDIIRSGPGRAAVLISSQHIHEIESVADEMLCLRADGRPYTMEAAPALQMFELGGDLPPATRDALRRRFGPGSLREGRGFYIVRAPAGLALVDLIALLPGATLTYARDISTSAMRLFRE